MTRAPVVQRMPLPGADTVWRELSTTVRGPQADAAAEREALTPDAAEMRPLEGRGDPLPSALRAAFEPGFGRDLGDVRVHTDAFAAGSARRFGALAYTYGHHVVFGAGQFDAASPRGQRLIAHELTHVAQQSGSVVRRQPDDAPEARAPSLLSVDYSQMCGGRPCITDEEIYPAPGYTAEAEAAEAEAIEGTAPVGIVGPFVVAVGTTITHPSAPPLPATTSPGTPRVVQGSSDLLVGTSTYSMAVRVGHEPVGLGPGALSGVDEATLVAHAHERAVLAGTERMPPSRLARELVDAGWRGGTLRLAACKTGICASGTSYAQRLANELAALGAETVIIAPKGTVAVTEGMHGLPQVLRPGQAKLVGNLSAPGRDWDYVTAERRPSALGTGLGIVTAGVKMGAMIGIAILHSKAVAERTRRETDATGFSAPGPTGDLLYDLGAWVLDPTDEASRSIPFSQRFNMSRNRQVMKEAADRKKPGDYYVCAWTTSDGEDPFGTPKYRKFYVKYRKGENGYWYTISCEDCEGDDFPPDLNKMIDPAYSDEEIRVYLELPAPFA